MIVKWSLIGVVGVALASSRVGVAQDTSAKEPAAATTQTESAQPGVDKEKTAEIPADELMLVPIETALDPPAPGEKRDEPSLKHADPMMRLNAIHALAQRSGFGDPISGKHVVTELLPAFDDTDARIREAAAWALGTMHLGKLAKPAIPKLVKNLKDTEFRVRYFSAVGLRYLGRDGKDAAPALLEALKDEHSGVRVEAAEALIRIDESQKPAVVPALKAVLDDKAQKTWIHVRAGQVLAIAAPGQLEPYAELFAAAMKHPAPSLRVRAAATLAQASKSGADRGVAYLLAVMDKAGGGSSGPRPVGQSQPGEASSDAFEAQEALQSFATIGPKAVSPLQASWKTLKPTTRQQLVSQLAALGGDALPLLLDSVKDPDPAIRQQATWNIGMLGPAAAKSWPEIREAIYNPPKAAEPTAPANSQPQGPAPAPIDPRVFELQLLMQIKPAEWSTTAIEFAKSNDKAISSNALSMLMYNGVRSPEVNQAIMEALQGDNEASRAQALQTLPQTGLGKEAIPAVLQALSQGQPYGATSGFFFLSQFGPEAKAAVPVLLAAVEKPETKYAAAEALAKIDRAKAKSIAPVFLKQLDSEQPDERLSAARTILIMDPSKAGTVLPLLMDVLKNAVPSSSGFFGTVPGQSAPPDPVSLAIALGQAGPAAKPAAPLVLKLARDPRVFSFSRPGLAEAAAKLDPALRKDAIEILKQLVYESPNPFLQADSAGILVRLDPTQAEPASAALIDVLRHLEEQGMGMAQKLGGRVVAGFAQMGPAGQAAIPALTRLQKGKDLQLAGLATDAIVRIQAASAAAEQSAAQVVEEVTEPDPEKARELKKQADANLRNGNTKDALPSLKKAVLFDPDEPLYAYLLAYAQHREGRVDDAKQTLQQAKALEKQRPILKWAQAMEHYQGPSRAWLDRGRRN